MTAAASLPALSSSPPPGPEVSPGDVASPARSAGPMVQLGWEVVSRRPHDTSAWTQGLLFDDAGRLFESTGIREVSQVRELDPLTGEVVRAVDTPLDAYGEGLALVGDRLLVQLTWMDHVAFRYDLETFAVLGSFAYEGEGWGLCYDGERLVMSDGSDRLTFRDPATFAVLGSVPVTADGYPVPRLNELECPDGEVWANVWGTDAIVRIDPSSGAVTGFLDLRGLVQPDPSLDDPGAVLNGIARSPSGDTWLLTGKLWPEAVEVRILEP
jgi:glutamine cyclotransferase